MDSVYDYVCSIIPVFDEITLLLSTQRVEWIMPLFIICICTVGVRFVIIIVTSLSVSLISCNVPHDCLESF